MINSYLNITVIAEWITFFTAVFLLDKRTTIWRLFILLLFLILCTETLGWYTRMKLHIYTNALPFNVLLLVTTLFFIWIFSKSQFLYSIKKWLAFAAVFFALFWFVNLFFFQGLHNYNSLSEAVADIILVVVCCYFLLRTLKIEEPVNLLTLDYFWLANGLLFYSLGSALFYQFSYVFREYNRQTQIDIGNYIGYSLNLLLYTGLIVSFICRRKATR